MDKGRLKTVRVLLIVLIVCIIPLLTSCRKKITVHETPQLADEAVDVVPVMKKEVSSGVEFSGTVVSERTAVIAPKIMAQIEDMTVREGDLVEQGQLLARLDSRDIEAKMLQAQAGVTQAEASYERTEAVIRQADASYNRALAGIDEGRGAMIQAQANLALAKKNLDRFKDLYAEESIPLARLDEVQAQYEFARSSVEQVKGRIAQAKAGKNEALSGKAQAQAAREEAGSGIRQARAQVQSAGVMLSYTSLYAPFKGVVTKKFFETGAMAAPGQPLLRLESITSLEFEVPVPESRVKDIPLNRPVTISIDALNRKLRGVVKTYIPSGDAATHTFKAKIALPPVEGLLPGMYGRIQLDDRKRMALLIPFAALVEKGKTRGVFKVLAREDGEKALFVPVDVGMKVQGDVEVLRGLSPLDQVIVGPPDGLGDGQPVKSRKKGN